MHGTMRGRVCVRSRAGGVLRVLAPALAAIPALSASPARADDASEPDVVYLADGEVLRGKILEVLPGGIGVQIRIAGGEIATLPRQEIMRFEHHEVPLAAAAAPGPAVTPTVWVHMEGAGSAVLRRAQGPGGRPAGDGRDPRGAWVDVCSAPCDRPVPLDGTYLVAGPGMPASTPFQLGARPGEYETLRVRGASRAAFTGGIVTLAAGPAVALGVALSLARDSLMGVHPLQGTDKAVFDVSIVAGGLATLVGVGLLAANASTSVSQRVLSANGTPEVVPQGRYPGVPFSEGTAPASTWQEERGAEPRPPALAVGMTLASGRF